MANSLQDQLLKAGLIDEKKAKKVKQEKRKKAKQQPKGQPQQNESKQRAQQALAEKSERGKALNRQLQQEAEHKAIAAQIKQLIETNRVDRSGGEIAYQFVDQTKIKKLYVTELLQNQLSRGRLAVVRLGDQYELVPAVVAEKIQQRDPEAVLLMNSYDDQQEDEDDPYADYQIPDDLMW